MSGEPGKSQAALPTSGTVASYGGTETNALAQLRNVAVALGPLAERLVFIGGAIAPLFQTNPVLPRVRATKDVDAVAATSSYGDYVRIQELLRERGFTDANSASGGGHHAHRWRTPTGQLFDLVPAGDHLAGTGGVWDIYALETGEWLDIGPGPGSVGGAPVIIRHASAVAFVALKWAAYDDRGRQDKQMSHDLEDILALVASRPMLPSECATAAPEVRQFIASHMQSFLDDPDADELIEGQLGVYGPEAVPVRKRVRTTLHQIATAAST
jgi:hypothetical protein